MPRVIPKEFPVALGEVPEAPTRESLEARIGSLPDRETLRLSPEEARLLGIEISPQEMLEVRQGDEEPLFTVLKSPFFAGPEVPGEPLPYIEPLGEIVPLEGLPGPPSVSLEERESLIRQRDVLLETLFPKFKAENILTFAKEQPNEFLMEIQKKGRSAYTEALLRGFYGAAEDDIKAFFPFQNVVVPIDGVQKLVKVTAEGYAFDDRGKRVGTYNTVTREWTTLPEESIAKDFWDALRFGTRGAWAQTKRFFVSALPNSLFPPATPTEQRLYGNQEWFQQREAANRERRDKFRESYVQNRQQFEEWRGKHPELEPKAFWDGLVGSVPATVAAMGATVTGAILRQPALGVTAGLAIMTPLESQGVYEALLEAGVSEDEAAKWALPVGGLISSIEVVADLPYLKALVPGLHRVLMKGITTELAQETRKAMLKKGLKTLTQIELTETLEEVAQQAVQNATVKVYDENQSLFEGLKESAVGAALMTVPLSLIGGGVSMRRVAPQEMKGLTEVDMKARGWFQDPERPGNWYAPIARAAERLGAALASERGALKLPGGEIVGRFGTKEALDKEIQQLEQLLHTPTTSPGRKLEIQNDLVSLRKLQSTTREVPDFVYGRRGPRTGGPTVAQAREERLLAKLGGRGSFTEEEYKEVQEIMRRRGLAEKGEQVKFQPTKEGELELTREPFEAKLAPQYLPEQFQLKLPIEAGEDLYKPPGLTMTDELALNRAVKRGDTVAIRKLTRKGQGKLLEERLPYQANGIYEMDPAALLTNPAHQPRFGLEEANIKRLVEGYDAARFLPIEVREVAPGRFEVVHGHHRLEAAKRLKLPKVPVKVLNVSPEEAVRIAEEANLAGKPLTVMELATLLDKRLRQGEDAQALIRVFPGAGLRASQVEPYSRLVGLPQVAKAALDDPVLGKTFTPAHAMELANAQVKYAMPLDEVQAFFNEVIMKGDLTPTQIRRVLDNFAPIIQKTQATIPDMFGGITMEARYTGIMATIRAAAADIKKLDGLKGTLTRIAKFIERGEEVPAALAKAKPAVEQQVAIVEGRLSQARGALNGQVKREFTAQAQAQPPTLEPVAPGVAPSPEAVRPPEAPPIIPPGVTEVTPEQMEAATTLRKAAGLEGPPPGLVVKEAPPVAPDDIIRRFTQFLHSPQSADLSALTAQMRSAEKGRRIRNFEGRLDTLLSTGMKIEEAELQALSETMAGPYARPEAILTEAMAAEFREATFAKVEEVIKAEPLELISTLEALTNALAGKGVPNIPGTKGGSAYTRLSRVFPQEVMAILEKPGPIQEQIAAALMSRPPQPPGAVEFPAGRGEQLPLGPRGEPLAPVFPTKAEQAQTLLELQMALAPEALPPTFYEPPIDTVIKQPSLMSLGEQHLLIKLLKTAGWTGIDIGNALRGMKASYDWSWWRQVAPLVPTGKRAFLLGNAYSWRVVKTLGEFAPIAEQEIRTHPYYQYYIELAANKGYDFLRPLEQKGIQEWQKEEQFMVLGTERPIPKAMEKVPGMRLSQQLFVTGINKMTWEMFVTHINNVKAINEQIAAGFVRKKPGESFDMNGSIAAYAAMLADMSGRAKLGPLRQLSPAMNAWFFSMRLNLGRILTPRHMFSADPLVRKQAIVTLTSFIGSIGAVLLLGEMLDLWDVETDSRSADFGKIRIGPLRFDPWGGFQQFAVFAARMVEQQQKSATTGVVSKADLFDISGRLIRSKLAPGASVLTEFWTGRDFLGEPVDMLNPEQWIKRMAPFTFANIWEVLDEDTPLGPIAGPSVTGALSFVGIGTASYPYVRPEWKKDMDTYQAIPTEAFELEALRRKAAERGEPLPLSREQFRQAYPEIEAKLFITGQVDSIGPKAINDTLRLIRENNINYRNIQGFQKIEEEEKEFEKAQVLDPSKITATESLLMLLRGQIPSPLTTPGAKPAPAGKGLPSAPPPKEDARKKAEKDAEEMRLRIEAALKNVPENLVDAYVAYSQLPDWGLAREQFLMTNPEFYRKVYRDILDNKPLDFSKIPSKEMEPLLEEYRGLPAWGFERERFLQANPNFYREVYLGILRGKPVAFDAVPSAEMEKFIDRYKELPDAGYERERFLQANPRFYEAVYLRIWGNEPLDFAKVPSREQEALIKRYRALPAWGYEQEWFLQANPGFYKEVYRGIWDYKPVDFGKVPSREMAPLQEEYRKLPARGYVQERFLQEHPEFYKEVYLAQGGKPLDFNKVPSREMEDLWDEYGKIPTAGYANERFLVEHPEFYKDVYLKILKRKPIDFATIPSQEIEALYEEYQTLPLGDPRKEFRRNHPDLNAWGIKAKRWGALPSPRGRSVGRISTLASMAAPRIGIAGRGGGGGQRAVRIRKPRDWAKLWGIA